MYYVVTKNSIPGFHYWEEAPYALNYLRSKHRHVFDITCKFEVMNGDRELEIISMQNDIQRYLLGKYGTPSGEIDIGGMSCEDLAKEIADKFSAFDVLVQEDGYGGGGYVRKEC